MKPWINPPPPPPPEHVTDIQLLLGMTIMANAIGHTLDYRVSDADNWLALVCAVRDFAATAAERGGS